MNRIYRSIWNEVSRSFVAVAETVRSQGKPASSSVVAAAECVAPSASGDPTCSSRPGSRTLRSALRPLALEQRFMFDGAAVATVDSHAHDSTAAEAAAAAEALAAQAAQAATPARESDKASPADGPTLIRAVDPALNGGRREVAFIDSQVVDYQSLVSGIPQGIEIQLVDGTHNGLEQIAQWAASHHDYDAIHILGHGSSGALTLGTATLDGDTFGAYQDTLGTIGGALKAHGDILLYGCNVAATTAGTDLIQSLARATRADVAASDDATGATRLGGDWVLESTVNHIETRSLQFAQYDGLLANPDVWQWGAPATVVSGGQVRSLPTDTFYIRPNGTTSTVLKLPSNQYFGYYEINSGGPGYFEYSTNNGSSWTILANHWSAFAPPNALVRFHASGGSVSEVDFGAVTCLDATNTTTAANSGFYNGGGYKVRIDTAPTDIASNNSSGLLVSDTPLGSDIATLTPTDTGTSLGGYWAIDSQTVSGLFGLSFNAATGNTAHLVLASTSNLPSEGQTASVTVHFYDALQTDVTGAPIGGQGVTKTYTFTIKGPSHDLNFGNDIAVNPLAGDTVNQSEPAITTLSNGNFVVTWADISNGGIYSRVFDSAGTAQGAPITIDAGSSATQPSITALAGGKFAVVYGDATTYDIRYKIIDGATGSASSNGLIEAYAVDGGGNQTGGWDGYDPIGVAASADGSQFSVTWNLGNYTTVKTAVLSDSGTPNGAIVDLSGVTAGFAPVTAVLANGDVVTASIDGNVWAGFNLTVGGALVSGGPVGDNGTGVSMATLDGGGFVVAWSKGDGSHVYAQTFSNAGTPTSSILQADSQGTAMSAARVSALGGGGFVVVWQSDGLDGSGTSIQGRRFDAAGSAVDAQEFQVNEYRYGDQSTPVVTPLDNGAFATAWVDSATSGKTTGSDIEARVLSTAPSITSATYDAATGVLNVTGDNIPANASGADIVAALFTLGGEGSATYTLTDTADVERTSATQFVLTLSATDRSRINQILNRNGTSASDGSSYNLAAADNWAAGATPSANIADTTGNAITVSNVALPAITSATYDAGTGVLTVTGSGLTHHAGSANDIDVTRLTLTGAGGATYTLTASTSDVDITSDTSFTLNLGSTDKTAVDSLLTANGTQVGGVTYNLAAADNWERGADSSLNIADTVNGVLVSGLNPAPTITPPADINLADTGATDTFAVQTGTLSATDADGIAAFGIQSPTSTNAGFTHGGITYDVARSGTYGTLYLVSTGADAGRYAYVPDAGAINGLTAGATPTDVFTVTATDANASPATGTATLTVHLTGANDAPTLSATGLSPTFTENGSAVTLFSGASASAAESGQNLNQLILTVSNVADGSSELLQVDGSTLALTHGNSLTTASHGVSASVSLSGGVATVTLDKAGGLSTSVMQSLIDGLGYRNTSESPSTSNRVVTLTSLRDTGGTANGGQDTTVLAIASTVTVVSVNDAPTDITLSASSLNLSAATASAPVATLGVADLDTSDTHSYALVSGSGDADNGRFVLSGNTLQVGGAALSAGTYSLRLQVTDNGGLSYTKAVTVTVVDDVAPTLDAPGSTPAGDASGVAPSANLQLHFDEAIAFGTSGTITLRNVTTGTVVQTWNVATPGDLGSGNGQIAISGSTLTLNPTATLDEASRYAVRIAPTALRDTAGNAFAGIADDSTYRITTGVTDSAPPALLAIQRASPSTELTRSGSVSFTLRFNEAVTNADLADFALSTSGTATGTLGSVTGNGTETLTVTVTGVSGTGTLGLSLGGGHTITDIAGNALPGGNPADTELYHVDRDAPGLVSINRVTDDDLLASGTAQFIVVFREPVTQVDVGDFNLLTSGSVTGQITAVAGNGSPAITVSIGNISGNGTLGIELASGATVTDVAGNALLSATPLAGIAERYQVDRAAPTALGITRVGTERTRSGSVSFNVVFSEPVSHLDATDFTLVTSGTAAGTVTGVSGSGSSYTVTVGSLTGSGTVGLAFAGSQDIADAAGLAFGGTAPALSESFVLDNTPPTVTAIDRGGVNQIAANTPSDAVFTVVFSEPVSNLSAADFTVTGSAGHGSISAVDSADGKVFHVTVTGVNGTVGQTLGLSYSGSVDDAVGLAGTSPFSAGQVYTVGGVLLNEGAIDQATLDALAGVNRAGTERLVAASAPVTQVVILDSRVPGLAGQLSALPAGTEVWLLDAGTSATAQISQILAHYSGLSAIHLISHGSSGAIYLGAETLSDATLAQYASALAAWGAALSPSGDLLVYGCDVAQGAVGQRFVAALADATGADVAASTDLTGAPFLGGNWVLEDTVGTIDTGTLQADGYYGTLSPVTFDFTPSNGVDTGTSGYVKQLVSGVKVTGTIYTTSAGTTITGSGFGPTVSSNRFTDTTNSGRMMQFTFSTPSDVTSLVVGYSANSGTISGFTVKGYQSDSTVVTLNVTPTFNVGYTVSLTGANDWSNLTKLQVIANGGGSVTFFADTIVATPSNPAPTDIQLSSVNAPANLAGARIANIRASDSTGLISTPSSYSSPNDIFFSDTETYTEVADPGDLFTVDSTGLLSFSAGKSLGNGATASITLRATDSAGNTFDKAFTITGSTYNTLTVSPSQLQNFTYGGAQIGTTYASTANWTGSWGNSDAFYVLAPQGAGADVFDNDWSDSLVNTIDYGALSTNGAYDSLAFQAGASAGSDSFAIGSQYYVVTVGTPNAPPVVDLNGTTGSGASAAFVEATHQGTGSTSGVVLVPAALLSDSDGTVNTVVLSLANSQSDSGERLYLSGSFSGVTYSLDSSTQITLTRTGTTADLQSALRAVRYQNNSDNPNVTTRSITVTATDNSGGSSVETVTVSMTRSNDAPTDISLSSATVNQSGGTNAVVGTLSTTDVDSGSFSYSLVSGTGDTDNSLFNIASGSLRANDAAALAAGSYSVRVQTSDGSGGTYDKIFTITVADNVAPVFDVAPATANVTTDGFDITASLNEAGTVLYVIVPRNAAAPSVAQVLAGQDASGSAALGSGSQSVPSAPYSATVPVSGLSLGTDYDVYVVARDSASPANAQAAAVKLSVSTLSNTAPALGTPTVIALTDTAAADTFSHPGGQLSATDTDGIARFGIQSPTSTSAGFTDNGITYDIARTGTYGTLYVVSTGPDMGRYVYVPDATAINAVAGGATPSDSFTVTATDANASPATGTATLTVNITGANDTPAPPTLNGGSAINANESATLAAATLGTLAATDAENGTLTYTLVAGSGDADNARFSISGTSLRVNATPLAAGTYSLRVRVTDNGSPAQSAEQVFSVQVSDDVAPTLQPAGSTPQNGATGIAPTAQLEMAFSENVHAGSGTVTLVDVTTGTVVETFDAATSIGSHGGTLSFSGTALVVTPGSALDQAHQFALQVPGTAVIDGSGNAYAGTSGNTDYHFTTGALDTTAPRVTLVDIADPVQPNAGTVNIRFSEAVQNVGISNFVLTRDGVPVDLSGLSVGGSGATYTLDLSPVTGTAGTYVLTLAPGSIQDSSGNALAVGASDSFVVDTTAPAIAAITRASATPTQGGSLDFTVAFSEAVSGVDVADFQLSGTATAGASIASVTALSDSVYRVTVTGASGNGTLGLDLRPSATGIQDRAGNAIGGGATGQRYTLDNTAPGVTSIRRSAAELSAGGALSFTVSFSEAVTGVDASDFTVDKAAGVNAQDADISVSGSGNTYTVTVASVGGNGLFSVDLKASGTGIADRSGNALVGGYTAGDTYLLDSTAPIVAPSQAFSIPENMATGLIIGQVRASDANRLASFRIASGDPNGYFTIDSDGVVRLSAAGAAPNAPSRDYETAPNLFTLDIIATDAAGLDSATQSITIQVLDAMENAGAPVFTTPTPVSLNDTRSYDTLTPASGTLQATDTDGIARYGIDTGTSGGSTVIGGVSYDVSRTGLYGTLYLNSSTGAYVYVPDAAAINALRNATSESFTLTATDANATPLSSSTTLTIDITATNDDPVLDVPVPPQTFAGPGPWTFTVPGGSVSDPEGDSLTWSATLADGSPLPAWLSFDPATRSFSGNPPNGVPALELRVIADDGHGGTVSDSFALSLGDVNDAPTQVSSIPDQAFSGAGAWSFTLPAGVFHDADNDTLSLSARQADGSALPGWLSFDAATGSFTGVPPFGRTPVDIVVVARDGHSGEVTAGFHFESNVPPPPLAPEPQAPTVLFVPPPPPRVIPDAPPTAPPSPFLPPGSPVALVNPSFDSPPPVSAPLPAVPVPPERPGSDRAPVLAAPPDALPPGSSPLVSVGPLPDGLPAASTRGGLVVTRPDQGAFDVVPARANTITLSAGTFVETVPGVSVSVSAMLDNGQALPPWISFNPGTGTLLVNPPPGLKRDVTIRIVARDQNGQEAVTFVRVRVGSQRTTSSLTPAADALREVRPQVMPLDDLTRPDGSAALPPRPVADVARPAGHTGRDSLASQLQRAGRGPGVSGRLQAIAQAAEAARRDGA